jgi:ribosome-binding factor A
VSRRLQRINVLLRQQISELIRRELRDPRLAEIVTITRVNTSADLTAATVYVSIMGDDEEKKETITGLTRAAPVIRRQLTGRLAIRRTPNIQFALDESMEEAAHVLDLMNHLPGTRREA